MTRRNFRTSVIIIVLVFISGFSGGITSAQSVYGGIQLLNGYKYRKGEGLGVLSAVGTIYKENGLIIEIEEGLSQGYAANRTSIGKYAWFKEQVINGQSVRIALTAKGVKTVWEPDRPRDSRTGHILLVTFPLSNQVNHAVNFRAELLNEEELADALLMILTFDAKKLGSQQSTRARTRRRTSSARANADLRRLQSWTGRRKSTAPAVLSLRSTARIGR